jgi:hypothetical protein
MDLIWEIKISEKLVQEFLKNIYAALESKNKDTSCKLPVIPRKIKIIFYVRKN